MVVQLLRILIPMQGFGTWVQSLVWEDSTFHGAPKKWKWKWRSLSHFRLFCNPMDYTVHGILQARIHSGSRKILHATRHLNLLQLTGSVVVTCGLSCLVACGIIVAQPRIQPTSPALGGRFLMSVPQGSPSKKLYELYAVSLWISSLS